mmetsp:Transcript_269/g.624  ORF Transcript_269/g.624 Transcript_269/m.624 type:complete len:249 (-) Transcript_269:279-1025(-)
MLVTGGLGGLGLIASFHCASEFENPIITTSRSGRLPPSAGPQGMNIFEAIREIVPIYNVQLDVGNSKALADLFAWLNRPGVPFEERSMLIDDIVHQLKYKMHSMPQEALAAIQEFLFEMRDKLTEIVGDLTSRETKIKPEMVGELQAKIAAVSDCISRLSGRVGTARTGRCKLVGGVPPASYSVPEGGWGGDQTQALDKDQILHMMQDEMHQESAGRSAGMTRGVHGFGQQALTQVVAEMREETLLTN